MTSTGYTQRAGVITCSDSVAAGRATDRSGPAAAAMLDALGFVLSDTVVVADEVADIQAAITKLRAEQCRLVVLTGGTGIGPRDVTPEAIAGMAATYIPGVGEAMRAAERERLSSVDLSRSGAWVLADCLLVALPGSPAAVQEGLAVVAPLLDHALAMIDGGGHPQASPAPEYGAATATAVANATGSSELVSSAPIDPAQMCAGLCTPADGALVTFEGRVRDHDAGRPVTSLRYEGHPAASAKLADLLAQARSHPGVGHVAAAHRVGELTIGDLAFFVAVSAAHRQAAFDTAMWLVDEVKHQLPVWKLQRFADGSQEWVNCA